VRYNCLLHIITGSVVLPLMLFIYWLAWPYRPVVETADPLPVSQVIYPGETFHVLRQFCVQVNEVSESIRSLTTRDGTKISLAATKHATPPGCHTRTYLIETPPWIPPGSYQYEATLTFEVNPLRNLTVPLKPVTVVVSAHL
jgi:hypothetical protein